MEERRSRKRNILGPANRRKYVADDAPSLIVTGRAVHILHRKDEDGIAQSLNVRKRYNYADPLLEQPR